MDAELGLSQYAIRGGAGKLYGPNATPRRQKWAVGKMKSLRQRIALQDYAIFRMFL
jgi:hypothetical protein